MTRKLPEGLFRRKKPGHSGMDPENDYFPGYYARWTAADGKRLTRHAGDTLREARAFIDEQRAAARERQRRAPGAVTEQGEELLATFAESYLERLGKRVRSIKERRTHLAAWRSHFGDGARLRDITEAGIEDFLAGLADRGRSVATRNRYLATLRHMLNTAVRHRKLEVSPIRGVRAEREENERTRTLTREEEARLLDAARTTGSPCLAALIILALETGARRGELLGLRWADVDIKGRSITFRKTKAKRTRQVPMTARARETLLALPSRIDEEPWIFTYRGERLLDPRAAFATACERAGLHHGSEPHKKTGEEGVVFHTLRHTFISRRAQEGVPASVIQAWSGHRTLAMVERYTHIHDAAVRAVADRMNEEWRRRERSAAEGVEQTMH